MTFAVVHLSPHFTELPFWNLFEYLNGVTTGPASFFGTIGKQLPGCEKLLVANLKKIKSEEINVSKIDPSKDQKYLLDVVRAVQRGKCDPDLAIMDPGLLSHSPWLTCANRVLRLYIFQNKPSNKIKILVRYIVTIYALVWFDIKKKPYVIHGPGHLFIVVQTTRHFAEDLLKIIDPVIQKNAFFAHPENLLLKMATDERLHTRE